MGMGQIVIIDIDKLSLTSDKPQIGFRIEEFSSALISVWCFLPEDSF